MVTRIDDIRSTDWSPQLGNPGEVVEDQADIEQCIDIILTTPLGSDPHRPLFGCDAWRWLDAPLSRAVPGVINEVATALELWEPRIKVVKVLSAISQGAATVTVIWQRKGSSAVQTTEVTIGKPA